MYRKSVIAVMAVALVVAVAFIAVGSSQDVSACDGKTKTASSCTQSASAAKVAAATASYDGSGCARTAKSGCTGAAAASCCAKASRQAHQAQVKAVADNIPHRENSRVVYTGTYKCGSCDLGKTDKCQGFIKTTDGHLYPLIQDAKVREMRSLGNKELEVTGRVKSEGGVKYVEVTTYKVI
jgi:hypothetical protein